MIGLDRAQFVHQGVVFAIGNRRLVEDEVFVGELVELLTKMIEMPGEVAGFHEYVLLPAGAGAAPELVEYTTGAKANRCANVGHDTSHQAVFVHSGECIILPITRLECGEWNARTSSPAGYGCQPGRFPL